MLSSICNRREVGVIIYVFGAIFDVFSFEDFYFHFKEVQKFVFL